MLIFIIGIGIWFGCGLLSAGMWFAYLQDAYPELAARDYRKDKLEALSDIPLGIASLLGTIVVIRHWYGWRLK